MNGTLLLPSVAVVIAHGPSRVTRAAVGRARALLAADGELHVVAGLESGVAAARSVRDQATLAEGWGAAATAACLTAIGDQPVLVLHDDVLLLPSSAQQLFLTHLRTGSLVVPHTHAPDTDHHGAGLDAADEPALRRRELGGLVGQRPLRSAGFACVVGRGNDLAEVVPSGGFLPGAIHHARTETGWVQAANAVAAHPHECRLRLAGPTPTDGRPLLVAALIVRDEEAFLGECLASIEAVVDRIEVVDTGSTDDTVAIAEAAGATVHHVDWRDDFAWARNEALRHCQDAHYVLWLDADERLRCDDPQQVRRVLNTYGGSYPAFKLEIRNLADGKVADTFRVNRIVSPAGTRFVGAIHEQPQPLDASVRWPSVVLHDCWIDHLGYTEAVMGARNKRDRNLAIARRQWAEERTADAAVHLARSLAVAGAPAAEVLEVLDAVAGDYAPEVRAHLLALRGDCLRRLGRLDEALDAATAAGDLVPADSLASWLEAELLLDAGRPDAVVAAAARRGARPGPAPLFDDHVHRARHHLVLVRAHLAMAQFAEACRVVEAAGRAPLPEAWRLLASAATTHDEGRRIGAIAAGLDDQRIDLAADLQLPGAVVGGIVDGWAGAGDEARIARLVAADHANTQRESADPLWATLEQDPNPETVRAYAACVLAAPVGAGDAADAADASDEASIASLLGRTSLTHLRRGDADRARRDVDLALRHDHRSRPAVVAAARLAARDDDWSAVVDLVTRWRDATGDRDAELADLAAEALARTGDAAGAIRNVVEVLAVDGEVTCWGSVVRAVVDDLEQLTLLVGAGVAGDGDRFIAAVAEHLRPAQTVEVCVAYLIGGGRSAAAVSTGVLAALVARRPELLDLFVPYGDLLDGRVADAVAQKLVAAGHDDVAGRLLLQATSRPTSLAPR